MPCQNVGVKSCTVEGVDVASKIHSQFNGLQSYDMCIC